MILLSILIIMLVVLTIITVAALSALGVAGVIIFGDIIVCIGAIIWIIRRICKKKK